MGSDVVFDHSDIMDYKAERSFDVIVANMVFHHLDALAHTIKCGLSPILFIADNSLNLRTDIAISPEELGGLFL